MATLDTLEYVVSNLDKVLALKTKSHKIDIYLGIDHTTLSIRQSATSQPLGARIESLRYQRNAVSRQTHKEKIYYTELVSLEEADLVLKRLLEVVCHIYSNEDHTPYYDPTVSLPPPTQRPRRPVPIPTISTKPDILKMIQQQLDEDQQWTRTHSLQENTSNA